MELTPKVQASLLDIMHEKDKSSCIATCDVVIQVLSELNQTKLCKFDKEIDHWNEVLKELENL